MRRSAPRPGPLAMLALLVCQSPCAGVAAPGVAGAAPSGAEAAPPPAAGQGGSGADAGALHVLVLNGGGNPQENFRSHLLHIQEMTTRLLAGGLPPERLRVLASDGQAPGLDVAGKAEDLEDAWLLDGTGLGRWLGEPIRYEDTRLADPAGQPLPVAPATRASLARFFQEARARLHPGDTLVLYVTDHGKDHPRDPRQNRITLWGPGEGLTVRQLNAELERLPAGVRVVALMSQCFSGGFAHLLDVRARGGLPSGAACGYFASTADRPAYGCYPEATSQDRVGHSFALLDGLAATGELPEAHARLLVADRTPDVPLRTSDQYLADELSRSAERAGQDPAAFADGLLADPAGAARRAPEWHLAGEVARAFGLPVPTTLAALEREAERIAGEGRRLDGHRELWATALADATRAHFQRLLAAEPAWGERLRPRRLRRLGDDERRQLTRELLAALQRLADTDRQDRQRLDQLAERVEQAAAAAYRFEVRAAVVLRLRILLTSAAARALLAERGSPAQRQALSLVEACEDLRLPAPPPPSPTAAARRPPGPAPFPSLAEDRALAASLHPSYLGVSFEDPQPALRARLRVGEGAALITRVQPGSPAQLAGLRSGDIVLGSARAPFQRANQIRSFTMLSPANQPLALDILRAGQRRRVPLTLAPFPDR